MKGVSHSDRQNYNVILQYYQGCKLAGINLVQLGGLQVPRMKI